VALGFSGSEYVGLMPVVLLDNIVLEWSRHGVPAVNDVLTHYMRPRVNALRTRVNALRPRVNALQTRVNAL